MSAKYSNIEYRTGLTSEARRYAADIEKWDEEHDRDLVVLLRKLADTIENRDE